MLILPGCIAAARQNQRQLNAEQASGGTKTQQSQHDPGLRARGLPLCNHILLVCLSFRFPEIVWGKQFSFSSDLRLFAACGFPST